MGRKTLYTAIVFVISMGVLVLLGWQLDIDLLKLGFPNSPVTMKANTALCFVWSGVALFLLRFYPVRRCGYLVQGFAGLTLAFGLLTLGEYIWGWNFGIDEWLFRDPAPITPTPYPGRMAQNTALCFVLVGAALLGLTRRTRRTIWLAQWCSLLVLLIVLFALTGYLFGNTVFYAGFVPSVGMAAHTLVTFIALSIGILLLHPHQGVMQSIASPLSGGRMARSLLPWAIFFPLVLSGVIHSAKIAGWLNESFHDSLLIVGVISMLVVMIWRNADWLNRSDRQLQRTQENLDLEMANRKVELKLQQREQFLRSIYEGVANSIFIVDVLENGDFHYVGFNPSSERLSGIITDEAAGKSPEQLFPADIAATVRQHYQDCVQTGTTISYEECLQSHTELTWWLTSLTPLRDRSNRIYRIIGTSTDITARKQAEAIAQQRAETEYVLRTLTQRIRQSLDLQQTLTVAVTEVQRFLNADRVVIYRVNPDGTGSVIVESVVPEQPPILDRPLPEEIFPLACHALYLHGRTRTVVDVEEDDMSPCLADTLRELGVRSKLVVPILLNANFTRDSQTSLWGLLIAHQCLPRRWQEAEVDLLEKLADQLGIGIYQANLYAQLQIELVERQKAELAMTKAIEQEQQLRERERFISTISRNIRQFLDLNYILNTTVDEVLQFLRADRVVVYQFNPDWSGKIVAESVSTPALSIIRQPIQDSCFIESPLVQAYRQGRIQTVDNLLAANLHPCYVGLLTQLQVQAVISIPIIVKQELWGLLIAHDCTGSRHWQTIGWSLLRQLSTQMAIGIQQAELYQQLQVANRDLHRYATTDSLTQVANRRAFEDHLQKEWQRLAREHLPLSLILCDVDYFKRYNDTYGHPAGDMCLVQVAQTIQNTLKRPADLVARYGGEEFIILLPNTDGVGAIQVVENIQQQIAQLQLPHADSLANHYVTLSFGIATVIPTPALTPTLLIDRADQCLYKAKAQGRNSFVI